MTQEYLTPERHDASRHMHDPYTVQGARPILRRFRDDVIAMLEQMLIDSQRFPDGKTMLANSPLRRKPWVAGAMKTVGLVVEEPTRTGACALRLTQKALDQLDNLEKYL